MTVRVVPEGLAAACAGVEALTARLAAAHAGAVPLIAAVAPPAADPVRRGSAFTAVSMRRWLPKVPKSSVARASEWVSRVPATPVVTRRCRISLQPTDDDRADLDSRTAGGAFGIVEQRPGIRVVAGGSERVEPAERRILHGS
jgi:hypothetical protein